LGNCSVHEPDAFAGEAAVCVHDDLKYHLRLAVSAVPCLHWPIQSVVVGDATPAQETVNSLLR
jgi:hypothetical protein